jgi:uncharacterized membrane protein
VKNDVSHPRGDRFWRARADGRAPTQQYDRNGSAHDESPAWIVPGYNSAVPRRTYIDWARGIAVLLMIEAHTLDAWTRASARHGYVYRDATVLGGFAAPLFLWLAGVAVVLAATRTAERTPPAVVAAARWRSSRARGVEIACRRGLEIFLLAFLFRLQGFIVTPGGAPVTIFRVDVLNIMGPSMVGVGLLWGAGRTAAARVAACAAAAVCIGMLTPIVRATSLVNALPIWLQWYMRPAGDLTIFTLFPWAGFVFAGGAVGALLATATDERAERRLQIILGASGAALIAFGFYAAGLPSIYRVSSFWTSSPTWFAIRVGVLMLGVAFVFTLHAIGHENTKSRKPGVLFRVFVFSWQKPLTVLGRSSLFVYWIHVELVYGYTTWLIRGRLPLWGTAIAYVVFCALIYGAIVLRDRLAGTWRARRVGPTTQTATA